MVAALIMGAAIGPRPVFVKHEPLSLRARRMLIVGTPASKLTKSGRNFRTNGGVRPKCLSEEFLNHMNHL